MGFVADIAKRSVFSYIPVFVVALLLAALGATRPFGLAENDAVLLAVLVFMVPVILALLLKSFRKALIGTVPIIIAILWTIGAADVFGLSTAGSAALFAAVVLGVGATDNLVILKDYFLARSQPQTVAGSMEYAFENNEKELLGASIIAIVTFLALSMASSPSVAQLGVVSALAITFTLISNVLVLPALTNLYEFTGARRAITQKESRVLHYAKSYGKHKETHPFYASWLGLAIEDVEDAMENLEAKGFLGPYFFTLQDPLVWFLLVFAYAIGSSLANFALPPLSMMVEPFLAMALLTIGLCVQGPQVKKRMKKAVKKVVGLLLIVTGGYVAYTQSMLFLEGYLLMLVVGLVSIYLAGTKLYILSNLSSAAYYGVVFALSWSHFGVLSLADNAYAIAFALIVFVTMLGIEEETYVKLESL